MTSASPDEFAAAFGPADLKIELKGALACVQKQTNSID